MIDVEGLILFDAGIFVGALLGADPRHAEARFLVEAARCGEIWACTTPSVLGKVYGALTWEKAQPRHDPEEAARATRLLIAPPSAIRVLDEGYDVALLTIELAEAYALRARRIHDARHAAAALVAGVHSVSTYDAKDWELFSAYGLQITGPVSTLARLRDEVLG